MRKLADTIAKRITVSMLFPNRETLFPYKGKDKLFHHFSPKLQVQTTILIDFAHHQYESQKQPPEVFRRKRYS